MSESKQNSPESFETPIPNSGKVSEETSPSVKSHKFLIVGLVLLLLLTAGAAAYVFAQNQSLKSQLGLPGFKLGYAKTCDYNGQLYQAGEGFTASDGCNSCSCDENGQVACTDVACVSDEELIESDQKTNWVTYQGQGFSYKYPSTLTQLDDPRGVAVYTDVKYYFANEAKATEYLNCLDQGKTQLEQYRQNSETVMEMVDWEGGCDFGRAIYQITVSSERSDINEPLSKKFTNQTPDSAIKISKFTDTQIRNWFVEDVVWGMADRVDVYSETTIGEQYYQIRILTNSRALSQFLGKEMMIQNGDGFDASPSIEHLEVFNKQFLSTFEFTDQTQDTITLTGRLVSMERPDPDINYDFQLLLDIPFFDELNAQGPRDITTIIVVPENESVRQMLTENLGNSVSIEGKIEWGLAETRHLLATSVNSKD